MRIDGRAADELRSVRLQRRFIEGPQGAVLVAFGKTQVLCTATVGEGVPGWLRGQGRGWVTAEYGMLPGSASGGRIDRNHVNKGRAQEISRLIGRSLRAVTNLAALGERQIIVDCDVIQADGGTRTAAITGAYVALCDAIASLRDQGAIDTQPIEGQCAAVSLGVLSGRVMLDLCYAEDSSADVDMNLVMKSDGGIVELQSTGEGSALARTHLNEMLDMGATAIVRLLEIQREALNAG
jgi:ribonuclease PH